VAETVSFRISQHNLEQEKNKEHEQSEAVVFVFLKEIEVKRLRKVRI